MDKPTIAVIGAGLMGHGIAYLFAAGGHEVRVQDPVPAALDRLPERISDICDLLGTDRAAVGRVTAGESLAWAAADAGIVIEAAPEKLALKQAIFAELERAAPADAILASNTSALPITRIAAGLKDKGRILGAHFWNPPHLVPLVEIVLMAPESAACSLSDISGWRDGVLYPLAGGGRGIRRGAFWLRRRDAARPARAGAAAADRRRRFPL
jgi:3-hydroxybutyryl-CoA dehydrogenase